MSKKVISLSPACTEIICALGGGDKLVGRSHLCDYPAEALNAPICTRPAIQGEFSAEIDRQVAELHESGQPILTIDFEKISTIRADAILLHAAAQSAAEIKAAFPGETVVVTPARMSDLWTDIQRIADLLGESESGRELQAVLKNRMVDVIAKTCMLKQKPSVACIQWIDPLMASGLWIPDLVEFAGGRDFFGEAGKPASPLDWKRLASVDPDIIVIMACGFNLGQTRREMAAISEKPEWKQLRAVRRRRVFLTDAAWFFSRPGPRLVESIEILAEILQPNLFKFGGEGKKWDRA